MFKKIFIIFFVFSTIYNFSHAEENIGIEFRSFLYDLTKAADLEQSEDNLARSMARALKNNLEFIAKATNITNKELFKNVNLGKPS